MPQSEGATLRNESLPTSPANILTEIQKRSMTKEDRRLVVLGFMAHHDLALPPRAIYRNLRFKHEITFSYSSVDNYLDEFAKEGLMRRVRPEPLANGEVVDAGQGKGERAYYLITETGKAYFREHGRAGVAADTQ